MLAGALAGCAERMALPRPVPLAELPGWRSDRLAEAIPAYLRSCAILAGLPPDRFMGGTGALARSAGAFAASCRTRRRCRQAMTPPPALSSTATSPPGRSARTC
jgi:hypothetical protein